MDAEEKRYFTYAVYDTVRSVPAGRAVTYGAIARAVGWPNMARLVGKVMSQCEDVDVPAHRVVNAGGVLSAQHFESDGGKMRKLLEAEGVTVVNGRIKQWKKVFWDPMEKAVF